MIAVNYPKPDEYFHIFVGNDQELKNYLKFLKNSTNVQNEKIILNRLFEFYLT